MKKETLLGMAAAVLIAFGGGILITKMVFDQPEVNGATEIKPSDSAELVSDPIYGDGLTEEELETLKEEEASDADIGMTIGEEFVIELEETQETSGF